MQLRHVVISGISVPVFIQNKDMTQQQYDSAIDSHIFIEWCNGIDSRFGVKNIRIQTVDYKGPKQSSENVMFVRMKVSASNVPFEQVVELRGGSVVILPILKTSSGDKFTILVKQPRIATGKFEMLELPAGMIDGGSFGGAAARELKEELEIELSEDQLIDITNGDGIYLSCGLLDEKVRFFKAEIDVTEEEIKKIQGKATGLVEEGETITLMVIPLNELPKTTQDSKALIAWALLNCNAQQ